MPPRIRDAATSARPSRPSDAGHLGPASSSPRLAARTSRPSSAGRSWPNVDDVVDEDVEEPRKRGKLIPILWIQCGSEKNLKIVARRGCAPAPGGTRNLPRRQYQGPRSGGNSQADRHRATGVREGLLNLRPAPRNRAPERSENAGDVKLRGTLHLIRGGCPFLVCHPRTDQAPSRCATHRRFLGTSLQGWASAAPSWLRIRVNWNSTTTRVVKRALTIQWAISKITRCPWADPSVHTRNARLSCTPTAIVVWPSNEPAKATPRSAFHPDRWDGATRLSPARGMSCHDAGSSEPRNGARTTT
jgi:hypothetical protein